MGKKIYTNYIQNERMSNDAFKLERLVNKSSQAFMIAGQALCSVQTAEKLMLWSFYGHPHPFAGLVLKTHLLRTWIAEVDRCHMSASCFCWAAY